MAEMIRLKADKKQLAESQKRLADKEALMLRPLRNLEAIREQHQAEQTEDTITKLIQLLVEKHRPGQRRIIIIL